MREALRDGQSAGRVDLTTLPITNAVGVGALAGLRGEVTIVDGKVLVSEGVEPKADPPPIREAARGEQATLLVLATTRSWTKVTIGPVRSYAELESAIAERLQKLGHELTKPNPVRVRGSATHVALHVINGACPVADPTGSPPWRFSGPVAEVELVGVFVDGATGRLTHHDRRSHLHAVAGARMGHLDDVAFEEAVLYLPSSVR